MRYDWRDEIGAPVGTEACVIETDRRLRRLANTYRGLEFRVTRSFRSSNYAIKIHLRSECGREPTRSCWRRVANHLPAIDLTSYAAEMTAQ